MTHPVRVSMHRKSSCIEEAVEVEFMKKKSMLMIAIGLSFTSLAFGDEDSVSRTRHQYADPKPGQIEGLSHYTPSALLCDKLGAKNVVTASRRGSEDGESASTRAN